MVNSAVGWGINSPQINNTQQQFYVVVNQPKYGKTTIRRMPNNKRRLPPSTKSRAKLPRIMVTGAAIMPVPAIAATRITLTINSTGIGCSRPQITKSHVTIGNVAVAATVKIPPLISSTLISMPNLKTTGNAAARVPVSGTGYIVIAIDAGGNGTVYSTGKPGMTYSMQFGTRA